MKLFLSLFLSVCISLAPLYSAAEAPDLKPIYIAPDFDMGTFPMDEIYKADQAVADAQTLLGEMKLALNNPSARKEISKNLDKPGFQKGLFAGLEKQGMAKEDIAELQQSLNDPVLREEAFSQIANLDMEKVQAELQPELNSESFQEETLSQNSELIAQLNSNIDQMIESDHAPGSMAMLGAVLLGLDMPKWAGIVVLAISLTVLLMVVPVLAGLSVGLLFGGFYSKTAMLFLGAVFATLALILTDKHIITPATEILDK